MSRMKDPNYSNIIRFKIEEDVPENSPNVLAIKLAEALDSAAKFQLDGETYRAAATAELQKAKQLQNVIFQIKERAKNPPQKISRMDPLSHYNLQDCELELSKFKARAVELQQMADDFFQKATENRNESQKLQIKIREANKKARG